MAAQGQIRTATQLDYDHRLLVTDRAGKDGWTTYPATGALQDQLLQQLVGEGRGRSSSTPRAASRRGG